MLEPYVTNFWCFYALYYACAALNGLFIPVYLDGINLNNTKIGLLLAVGSVITIISQPLWGMVCDRAPNKNIVLSILILFSALFFILIPVSQNFLYLAIILALFSFFEKSITPIADSVTLEYLETSRWKFGHLRIAGTFGFSFIAVVASLFIKQNVGVIFLSYLGLACGALVMVRGLPKYKGHQYEGKKIAMLKLFSSRNLTIFLAFNLVIQITIGYYNSFFPIYYRRLGADGLVLGWAFFLATVAEIPFLLTGDRLIQKIGVKNTLIGSAVIASFRWGILFLIDNIYVLLGFQLIHGLVYIIFVFSLTLYINNEAPKELRSSGQAMNALITTGVAPIVGNILGGLLSDIFGIRYVFLFSALLTLIVVVMVVCLTRSKMKLLSKGHRYPT